MGAKFKFEIQNLKKNWKMTPIDKSTRRLTFVFF